MITKVGPRKQSHEFAEVLLLSQHSSGTKSNMTLHFTAKTTVLLIELIIYHTVTPKWAQCRPNYHKNASQGRQSKERPEASQTRSLRLLTFTKTPT